MIFVFIGCAILLGAFMYLPIYRLPREIKFFSLSVCPNCGKKRNFFEYLPIIGYFVNRKCVCENKKSILVLLVPIFNAILWTIIYLVYGATPFSIIFMFFVSLLLVVSCIDYEFFIIPDRLHIVVLILVIFAQIFVGKDDPNYLSILDRFIGFLLGGLPLWIIGYLVSKKLQKEALGGGDIKLMAVCGAFVGPVNILFGLVCGCIIALIIEKFLSLIKVKENGSAFAFGPYLALGMVLAVFFASNVVEWYINLITF